MATNIHLKIDGIEGESQDKKGEIDILSFSVGATQSGTSAQGGGGGAGKVSFSDISVTKHVDKASPKIFEACATGKHIPKAVISVKKAGGSQEEYMKWTLSDVVISGYSTSGSNNGDEIPMEQVSFNFAKIETEYKEQKASGQVGGAVKAGFDLKTNKKV